MAKPKFRYKKYPSGWVVEYLDHIGFWIFKKKVWKHFVSVSGIESLPWYHSKIEYAEMNLKGEVALQAMSETKNIQT